MKATRQPHKGAKRFAHVLWSPKTSGGYPGRVMAVDTETHPEADDPEYQELTLGWWMMENITDKRSKDHGHKEGEFTDNNQLWDAIEEYCTRHRPLTVLAINMSGFDLKIIHAESQLMKRGWEITHLIIPRPFMLHARKKDVEDGDGKPRYRQLTILDLNNFYPGMSAKRIGATLKLPKGEPPGGPADPRYHPVNGCVPGTPLWGILSRYCRRDTEIVLRAFETYVAFCLANDLGPFRETISGQALAAFRWKTLPKKGEGDPAMWIHDNKAVLAMERDAYNGAVTDVWRRGHYFGEFYYLDVTSLYPYVMKRYEYPVKLVAHRGAVSVDELQATMKRGYGAIARVRIDTDLSEKDPQTLRQFPVRNDLHRLVFPIGRLVATLTTRELESALSLGIVTDVMEVAYYEMAPIFVGYVDFFFQLKKQYGIDGNKVFREITKLFLNALYGKWGQHNPEWLPTDYQLPNGEFVITFVNVHTEKKTIIRTFAGLTEKTDDVKTEAFNSFPGLAAHITADARMRLLELREAAGVRHCYYGDTDSLLTDKAGYENLIDRGFIDDLELGLMKKEAGPLEQINILAPKTYKIDGKPFVRKGVRMDAQELWVAYPDGTITPSGNVFWQVQFEGLGGAMRFGNPNRARVRRVRKEVTNEYTKGTIDSDGWIQPFRMEMW